MYFVCVNLTTLTIHSVRTPMLVQHALTRSSLLSPAISLGVVLGFHAFARLEEPQFRYLTLGVVDASAIAALVTILLG